MKDLPVAKVTIIFILQFNLQILSLFKHLAVAGNSRCRIILYAVLTTAKNQQPTSYEFIHCYPFI